MEWPNKMCIKRQDWNEEHTIMYFLPQQTLVKFYVLTGRGHQPIGDAFHQLVAKLYFRQKEKVVSTIHHLSTQQWNRLSLNTGNRNKNAHDLQPL